MQIQAKAHRTAVRSMAGLLANARIDQVIGELLRNSRRAGATRIEMTVAGARVRVCDDGCGMEDLDVLLHLGATGWCGPVEDEEPDGVGFFTVGGACGAGRPVRVASRPTVDRGNIERQAVLTPWTFRGEAPAEVSRKRNGWVRGSGTAVEMTLEDPPREWWLEQVARYFRLPVTINGSPAEQVEYASEQEPDRMLKWRNSNVAVHDPGRFDQRSWACLDGRTYCLPIVAAVDYPMIRVDADPADGLRPRGPGEDGLAPGEALEDLKRYLRSETAARVF